MKKKWIWITIAAVLLAAIIGGLIYLWYLRSRSGAHLVGGELYVDISGTGFVFARSTGEYTDEQTPVTVIGNTNSDDIFEGELMVLGFPITEVGTLSGDPVFQDLGNGFYSIYYAPVCTHWETVDDIDVQDTHVCTYEYTYYFYPEDPDFLIVEVYEWLQIPGEYKCVVVADSQEEAAERYQWFVENGP